MYAEGSTVFIIDDDPSARKGTIWPGRDIPGKQSLRGFKDHGTANL